MKNVLLTTENGDFKLLNSVDDGTNALIIDEVTIPTAEWIGEGTYTYTDGSFTYNIVKASGSSGNWQLVQDDPYNYRFQKIETKNDQIIDLIYPLGSIYMSVNAVNPGTLFGGTWEQIKDTFLLCAGDTYSNGAAGGEATHKLTGEESGIQAHDTTSSGTCSITSSGGHTHEVRQKYEKKAAAGTNYTVYQNNGTSDTALKPGIAANTGTHTHTVPNHTHKISAKDATNAHNNMPPYLAVNVWKRTA